MVKTPPRGKDSGTDFAILQYVSMLISCVIMIGAGACFTCGGFGHRAAFCPSGEKGHGGGGGKGYGSGGKGDKGKGKWSAGGKGKWSK